MKTTVKKTFLDIHEEEEWLNGQGEDGLMLVGYRNGEYEFEDVSPARFLYKVDVPGYAGAKKRDYLDFLEQGGISVVAEYGGRVYLRKNAADGPLELYTEAGDVGKQVGRRYSHFLITGVSQLLLGAFTLVQLAINVKPEGAPFWIAAVIAAGLIVSGIAFLVAGIRKWRRHAPGKREAAIWE